MRLREKVAIVTGGSSGIGRATCLALAREGASVVAVGRDRDRVSQTVGEILSKGEATGVALGLALDVACEKDMEEMGRQTLERFGRIDILIAAAGIMQPRGSERLLPHPVATMAVQEWEEVLGTNLRGVFLSVRAVLPTMIRQRRGWIINISSSRGGLYGNPYAAAYCASKFGVIGLSESLDEEVSPFGVKVCVVLPDVVDTPILGPLGKARLGPSLPPSRMAEFITDLLTMPEDTILQNPLLAPFRNLQRPIGSGRERRRSKWIPNA